MHQDVFSYVIILLLELEQTQVSTENAGYGYEPSLRY